MQNYKIHLPPNIPAKDFWSFVVYDNQTRSMLQTDQQFPSICSQKKDLVVNADSSVDVWIGPTAPQGHESNWVQTIPGKGWNCSSDSTGHWNRGSIRPGDQENSSWCNKESARTSKQAGTNCPHGDLLPSTCRENIESRTTVSLATDRSIGKD